MLRASSGTHAVDFRAAFDCASTGGTERSRREYSDSLETRAYCPPGVPQYVETALRPTPMIHCMSIDPSMSVRNDALLKPTYLSRGCRGCLSAAQPLSASEQHNGALHCTALRSACRCTKENSKSTALLCTAPHCTALHCTALHCSALSALLCTALHHQAHRRSSRTAARTRECATAAADQCAVWAMPCRYCLAVAANNSKRTRLTLRRCRATPSAGGTRPCPRLPQYSTDGPHLCSR